MYDTDFSDIFLLLMRKRMTSVTSAEYKINIDRERNWLLNIK